MSLSSSVLGFFVVSLIFPSLSYTERVEEVLGDGRYVVGWSADLEKNEITFDVAVKTLGWVGFGLSPTGGMTNADIVIGGVSGGEKYFEDRHGVGFVTPVVDNSQDWVLIDASENGTHTFLKFSRPLDTCDNDDIAIKEDTLKLIWSFGESDEIKYHGQNNRGTLHVNLLDPPMPDPDIEQFKKWVVLANDTMDKANTSYWCTVHKRPEMNGVHHVVGFDTRFDNPSARQHTHHFIFRKCVAPRGVDPNDLFGPHVHQPGQDCKARPVINSQCGTYLFVWAIGGRKTMFPDHVGHPIAELGEDEYFMLEIHYDNPGELEGQTFPTGLEIYYTDNLRPQEAGIMTFGHIVYWAQTIPPNSPDFTVYGHCSPQCTNNFPKDGLNVFNVLLHSHMSGRKLKLQQFRGNKELPWLAYDDFYDFNYQQNRPLREEKKIMPGDRLVMNCACDTTWKNNSVVIGDLGITDEMCEAFIWYYPRILIDTCMSTYNPLTLLNDFGIEQIASGGNGEMDPIIVRPSNLNGTRYTHYLNKEFNWTPKFREEYQAKLKSSYHLQVCASLANFTFFPRGGFVKFPENIKPYYPEDTCIREDPGQENGSPSNLLFSRESQIVLLFICAFKTILQMMS